MPRSAVLQNLSSLFDRLLRVFTRLARVPRRLEFRNAVLLSVGAHLSLLLMMSLILPYFATSDDVSPPLIFDYVFAPADDYDRTSLSHLDNQEEAKAPAEQKKSPDTESPSTSLNTRSTLLEKAPALKVRSNLAVSVSEKQLASLDSESETQALDQAITDALSEPRFVPEQRPLETVDPAVVLTAIKPTTIDYQKTKPTTPVQLSAQVAMTSRQHKMLRKKFKKWSEDLQRMELPDSSIVWEHKGRIYSARVSSAPAKSDTDIEEVVIEVTTEENGYTLASEMRMRRLAFSNFAQFVDYWDPRVAVHDDVLKGRFHTNTTFNVSQSYGVKPEFEGKVTTASYEVRSAGLFPFVDSKSIFVGGIETGVKEIRLPKRNLPFAQDSTITENQTQIFSEEAWVVFNRDGSFTWKTASALDSVQKRVLPVEESFYIVGSKKKKLHLKGVVQGRVLVYSPGKIVIDGSLTYAEHPELSSQADDYLGIVSDKDIEIAHPRVTGPGNLYLYASIYAKGRFKVTHLRGRGEATLYIFGSLTAGSLSATEPRYATHIQFDQRLQTSRPPNFPMTDQYEVTEWDGIWELKPQRQTLGR